MEINHYVAWMNYGIEQTARFQGFAESEKEFKQMCEKKGFDLSEAYEIECIRRNVRDLLGRHCKKSVSEW